MGISPLTNHCTRRCGSYSAGPGWVTDLPRFSYPDMPLLAAPLGPSPPLLPVLLSQRPRYRLHGSFANQGTAGRGAEGRQVKRRPPPHPASCLRCTMPASPMAERAGVEAALSKAGGPRLQAGGDWPTGGFSPWVASVCCCRCR
ncbi:hypothetical protein LZ32DRAFT_151240 [Colletotrichum eremochloae]|nr:hypothetical protein LZ32DRAFT_151240 [Colletotrichum eremochloae]